MSIIAAFHIPAALPARTRGHLRATLAGVVRRLADSPLDSPALPALNAQAPARLHSRPHPRQQPARLHPRQHPRMAARWRSVSSPDGSTRLEARWHTDH